MSGQYSASVSSPNDRLRCHLSTETLQYIPTYLRDTSFESWYPAMKKLTMESSEGMPSTGIFPRGNNRALEFRTKHLGKLFHTSLVTRQVFLKYS